MNTYYYHYYYYRHHQRLIVIIMCIITKQDTYHLCERFTLFCILDITKVFVYLQKRTKIGHFHQFLLMTIYNEMESYMTANEYLFAVRNVPCCCYM